MLECTLSLLRRSSEENRGIGVKGCVGVYSNEQTCSKQPQLLDVFSG